VAAFDPIRSFRSKSMKLTLLLLIPMLFPIVAQAKTAAQLREDCAAYDERPDSAGASSNLMRMITCTAYIDGVLDTPLLYDVRGADYCAPDGTTRNAAFNVVRQYIRRAEVAKMTWRGSGPQAVINAMREKWPCKDPR
jgi:hypothetical protein